MGNKQLSNLKGNPIFRLALNSKFGDGTMWRHPECVNSKVVFTSTTSELLELKAKMYPEVFPTGVVEHNSKNQDGRYENAKKMYRLASIVHPIFTLVHDTPKEDLIEYLTIDDLAMWYLDDGCFIKRNDSGSYRFFLCIGDTCNTPEKEELFISHIQKLFGKEKVGGVRPNNSKATENNKSWIPVKDVAFRILEIATQYNTLQYKIPDELKVQRLSKPRKKLKRKGVE